MALPKQVQAQLNELEEFEKTLTAQTAPANEEAAENLDTAVEVAEPEVQEEAKPAEVTPTETSQKPEPDEFKQKYNTLKGKYDAEVPRLHQQIRELNDKMKAMEALHSAAQAQPVKPKERVSLVTDADRAEFGEELLDVQRRVAKEVSSEYEDRLAQQEQVIRELQAKLHQTGNQVGEMSFAQRLRAAVPDFDKIDADERWVAWLNEYDPMLRGPRRELAQVAFNNGDADSVAHYVNLFKASLNAEEPTKQARQVELEKQVAPNRSAHPVKQSAGREAKTYTEREVQNAWNKIRVMNSRGQYDDAAKLEAELTAAYIQGRVRQ